jgi:hypothetical protein
MCAAEVLSGVKSYSASEFEAWQRGTQYQGTHVDLGFSGSASYDYELLLRDARAILQHKSSNTDRRRKGTRQVPDNALRPA